VNMIFHPKAPTTLKAAVWCLVAASALEFVLAVSARFASVERTSVSALVVLFARPLLSLVASLGLVLGLARMLAWLYWLAVVIAVPLVCFLPGLIAGAALAGHGSLSRPGSTVMAVAVSILDLVAAILLVTRSSREAVATWGVHMDAGRNRVA